MRDCNSKTKRKNKCCLDVLIGSKASVGVHMHKLQHSKLDINGNANHTLKKPEPSPFASKVLAISYLSSYLPLTSSYLSQLRAPGF